ncbi:MAG: glycosyltransferase family 39 protein [Chloroflexota bacterium]|nr:glycosyltransferase family 39 protein [Chloroflexota bacterium]MDE2947112.1 glycosyltransferase family 39 protein [Chloroflexota bacterium]
MSLRRWLLLVVILLLGALSRALHITSQSFWIDEGFSFFYAYAPDLVTALASDIHPPLYYAALRLWSELTGHSELALRWFSVLPSMCGLAFIYQLAREILRARAPQWAGEALPMLAMLMLALADAESYLAQEARHYTWLTLLVLISMLFLLRWLRRARRVDFSAWLLSSILVLHAHYMASFGLAAQGLYLLFWARGKKRPQALSALFLSALALAPWLLAVGRHQVGNRNAYDVWANDLSLELLHEIAVNYFSGQWALMIGLLALGCVALVYRRDSSVDLRFDRVTPLLLLWLTVPFCLTVLVNEFLPFLQPHRLIQWTPAIAMLAACGLCNIRQPIRALLIAVLVVYGVTQVEFGRGQPDWRRIARLTARYAVPGDLILTDVASGDFALRYYLVREEAGVPALEEGIAYEALHYQRLFAADTYEAWLPQLLDAQETVWLMYWSSDKSAFNWLDELGFKQSADFVHRHDGGANGETLMRIFRFDRSNEGEPAARFANGMILHSARFDLADLRLDTLWETTRPLERDYILSAKLLDANGVLVAQRDSGPQLNQRPTSGWGLGEFVYSPQEMKTLAPIPAGTYRLIVQVYTIEGDGFVNVPTEQSAEYALAEEVQIDPAR